MPINLSTNSNNKLNLDAFSKSDIQNQTLARTRGFENFRTQVFNAWQVLKDLVSSKISVKAKFYWSTTTKPISSQKLSEPETPISTVANKILNENSSIQLDKNHLDKPSSLVKTQSPRNEEDLSVQTHHLSVKISKPASVVIPISFQPTTERQTVESIEKHQEQDAQIQLPRRKKKKKEKLDMAKNLYLLKKKKQATARKAAIQKAREAAREKAKAKAAEPKSSSSYSSPVKHIPIKIKGGESVETIESKPVLSESNPVLSESNPVRFACLTDASRNEHIGIHFNGKRVGSAILYESGIEDAFTSRVLSASKEEKFYCLYRIWIEKESRGKGLAGEAFRKICNHFIEKGYSINLHDITRGEVGSRLFGGEKTRSFFDVTLETKLDGSWYVIRKKTGDTKPLKYLRIPKSDRASIFNWLLQRHFVKTYMNADFESGSSEFEQTSLQGLKALITYLKKFPKDAKEAQKTIRRLDGHFDVVVNCLWPNRKEMAERTALRKQVFELIWP